MSVEEGGEVIKIDMEMPKSCSVCKLKTWEQSGMFNKAICVYTWKRAKRINDRPKDCLLKEMKNDTM
jgi:hypothetical protein